jgi:long-chain acyl-CoA synthetase
VPDDRLGEVPWAFVVPVAPTSAGTVPATATAPAADAVVAAVLDQCRTELAPYKIPARVELVDELPRNEIGKVLTRDLVERARVLTASTTTNEESHV